MPFALKWWRCYSTKQKSVIISVFKKLINIIKKFTSKTFTNQFQWVSLVVRFQQTRVTSSLSIHYGGSVWWRWGQKAVHWIIHVNQHFVSSVWGDFNLKIFITSRLPISSCHKRISEWYLVLLAYLNFILNWQVQINFNTARCFSSKNDSC